MLRYDVFYPHSRSCDNDASWTYCEEIAKDGRNEGARAVCTNGPRQTFVLRAGRWEQEAIVNAR